MQSALSSAVSGLNALQKALDVVGGNLANVNTPGFKSNVITFKEAISSVLRQPSGPNSLTGSVNPLQLGEGVGIGSMGSNFTQGGLQVTGRATDMAITGDGFFVVRQLDGTNAYGRNGNFTLDKDGLLTTADGLGVLGWQAESGTIDTTQPVGQLTIPLGRLTLAKATGSMGFSGNLDATLDATDQTSDGSVTSGILDATAAVGATATGTSPGWIDRNGVSHAISYSFTKTVENAGQLDDTWQVSVNGVTASGAWTGTGSNLSNVNVVFDAAGNVASVNGVAGTTLTVNMADGTGTGQDVTIDFAGLANGNAPVAVVTDSNGSAGGSQVSSSIFYDSLGVQHTMDLTFTKVASTVTGAGGEWVYTTAIDGAANTSTGRVVFTAEGLMDATNSTINPITFTPTNGAADVSIAPDLTEVTQLATTTPNSVIARTQDGVAPGVLQSFSVDQDGTIQGTFSNGLGNPLGRLAVATFQNKQGLLRGMNGLLLESAASGTANIQPPAQTNGQGTPGIISSGALENSNVDIGNEFTNMIVAQRAFQANARMVNVVDQVLDELANLKR